MTDMSNIETNAQPTIVEAGQISLAMLGIAIGFKAVGADTGGQWSLLEYTAPPQFRGPHLHWHKVTTEAFYVLEGTLRLQLGEETHGIGAGAFALVPPGTLHTWSNPAPEPLKYLVWLSPAGLEGYFGELAELIASETSWPPADMSKVHELALKYDTYPPPGV